MMLLKLAWRDIWRNRRRSLITMGAIVFSLMLIMLFHSLQNGTYDAMEEVAVRIFTGDVQVHRAGFEQAQLRRAVDAPDQGERRQAVGAGRRGQARQVLDGRLHDVGRYGELLLGSEPAILQAGLDERQLGQEAAEGRDAGEAHGRDPEGRGQGDPVAALRFD